MGKCFRSSDVNQALLLPPSLHDWLPEEHLARFLVDVVDALDLGAIYESYEELTGQTDGLTGQTVVSTKNPCRLRCFRSCNLATVHSLRSAVQQRSVAIFI